MLTPASQIALLGFGPQAERLALALVPRGCTLKAFDPAQQARIEARGVDALSDAAGALRGARLVVVDEGAPAADVVAALLQPGQLLLDFTAIADDAPAGADPAPPRVAARFSAGMRLQVAGPRAAALAEALTTLGLPADAVSSATLRASPRPARSTGSPHGVPRGELP